jgi:hypothetical protein
MFGTKKTWGVLLCLQSAVAFIGAAFMIYVGVAKGWGDDLMFFAAISGLFSWGLYSLGSALLRD